jgi:hypothetical protein
LISFRYNEQDLSTRLLQPSSIEIADSKIALATGAEKWELSGDEDSFDDDDVESEF